MVQARTDVYEEALPDVPVAAALFLQTCGKYAESGEAHLQALQLVLMLHLHVSRLPA
jgi:hypothetical protein